jgi:hypothetical protein
MIAIGSEDGHVTVMAFDFVLHEPMRARSGFSSPIMFGRIRIMTGIFRKAI